MPMQPEAAWLYLGGDTSPPHRRREALSGFKDRCSPHCLQTCKLLSCHQGKTGISLPSPGRDASALYLPYPAPRPFPSITILHSSVYLAYFLLVCFAPEMKRARRLLKPPMAKCGMSEPGEGIQSRLLVTLLVINALMFLVEVVVGWLAQSTALLADSLDMLADAAVYGIALLAVGQSDRFKTRAALSSGI